MEISNPTPKSSILIPPSEVRGITILDRDTFKKDIEVPSVKIPVEDIKEAIKVLKPCFLKMPNFQPVQSEGEQKRVILNPDLFDEKLPYLQTILQRFKLNSVTWTKMSLTYDNWTSDNIFKAVLPPDSTGNVSSFSIVGHIIHVNLKPDLMEYKHLIGQVLLDKYSNIKTVVNKVNIIDSEFRNFNLELLAGDPNYEVMVKENNCQYAFDFSKVFWNPRLVNEHNEIIKKVNSHDFVYDVFAGVGPFAVPLSKKKCQVHANDLNPDSFKWLKHNAKLNKVTEYLHPYNLDGKEFIQTVVKKGIIEIWNNEENEERRVHVLMNLPASALEFLEAFKGLLVGEDVQKIGEMPVVYCYFFKRKDEDILDITGKYFDAEVQKALQITEVRLVAPNKTMMRITYKIPKSVLFKVSDNGDGPPAKRLKQDNESTE
ncbi:hypothetical protein JTE90_025840 [Oedothorax gibbosus]|uniref:tRNA (guanine(37)-N1)-methyltransferase n=1 Tax=Oedothorax gibbosus TaxID=931172 RepID=A0AAV6UVG5_9ARAC|nr:hypothetical protein JTE90_025840 [Oedothorax gibbosus]